MTTLKTNEVAGDKINYSMWADPSKMASQFSKCKWDPNFTDELLSVDKETLYKVWKVMMTDPKFALILPRVRDGSTAGGKSEDVLKERLKNRKLYLGKLTERVLSLYRDELFITEDILYQMVLNDLQSSVMFLLDHPELYKWGLANPVDLAIVFSIDTINWNLFILLLDKVKREHLEYIYHCAPFTFILYILEFRSNIPNFDETMRDIFSKSSEPRTWKHLEFIRLVK